MMKALDTVILTTDIQESQLIKGDMGTVVMTYANGEAFDVEFVATDGSTIAVEHLAKDQVRPDHGNKEIMHVRALA